MSAPRPGERSVRWTVTLVLLGGMLLLLTLGADHRWEWGRVWVEGDYARYLLSGLLTTLWISLLGMVLGLLFGFAGGMARLSRRPALQQVGATYVELVRGTPLLVQIFVAFYCLAPALRDGLRAAGAPGLVSGAFDDPVFVGVLTLGTFAGAYVTEIVRAAVESVDRGQTEAALSQGMTHGQVLRLVLLPQALRRMIPPLTGELVSLVKDSSLLSIIAVSELSKRASEVQAATYKTYEVFLPLAVLYLAITFPLSRLARRLEVRLR